MKNKGFGHLKTRLFTIKTSKNVGFGGPKNVFPARIYMSVSKNKGTPKWMVYNGKPN